MSTTNIQSVQDLYDLAPGGVTEIAYKLKIHYRTVERWRIAGIPDRYHEQLNKLFGATPFELYKLTQRIRARRK